MTMTQESQEKEKEKENESSKSNALITSAALDHTTPEISPDSTAHFVIILEWF